MREAVLAYTPFLDPLPLQNWWYLLLLPLAFGIAVSYKAVRVGEMKTYPRQVLVFTTQIVIGILVLGVFSLGVIEYLLPVIAPMP